MGRLGFFKGNVKQKLYFPKFRGYNYNKKTKKLSNLSSLLFNFYKIEWRRCPSFITGWLCHCLSSMRFSKYSLPHQFDMTRYFIKCHQLTCTINNYCFTKKKSKRKKKFLIKKNYGQRITKLIFQIGLYFSVCPTGTWV